MVKERTNPHLPADDVRYAYVSGKDVAAEQDMLTRGRWIEQGAQLHKPWRDDQWKPNLRPMRRFRVTAWIGDLAAADGEDAVRVLYTHTKQDNQILADYLVATGHTVTLDLWEVDLPQDEINRGWGHYGHRSPTVTP
jgi:hypothetical protein